MQKYFEKIIERLEELKTNYKTIRSNTHCRRTETNDCDSCRADHYLDARLSTIKGAIEIVNQVAEEYNQSLANNNQSLTNDGWIPCSERLPQYDYDTVLCVTDTNFYAVMVYTKEYGFRSGDLDFNGEIIAWQPLPTPYQPKGE